jgi:hypothetical protein
MPTGFELFSSSLKRLGASHIFTLVGDHLNDPLQILDRDGFTIIDTRHESAAVHMADGWARMTRTPVEETAPRSLKLNLVYEARDADQLEAGSQLVIHQVSAPTPASTFRSSPRIASEAAANTT